MDTPNPKRSRQEVSSSIQNPNSLPTTTPKVNQNHLDSTISSILSFPQSLSASSVSRSIDSVLDKALASVSDDVTVQDRLVNGALELQLVLVESIKRCFRRRASVHNSNSWFLPPELTVKVFSMLDTKSLMQAMACCTMFQKCAMEPSSYSHINLTSAKNVEDEHVVMMIYRARKELRFLELGHAVPLASSYLPLVTASCLAPLSFNNEFIGKRLRTLHLYNVRYMTGQPSISAISACSNLTDLKIVGTDRPCNQLLKSLTTKCRFIERLFLETHGLPITSRRESSVLVEFLTNIIPNLTSLSLIGFNLQDTTIKTLTESTRKLKHMDMSRNTIIKGRFLRDSGSTFRDGPLETLILQDCSNLNEERVSQFLNLISSGKFRYIRHIDISNYHGIVSDGGEPKFPLKKLKEERPNVNFVADYTSASRRVWDSSSDEDGSSGEEDN